ncbi:unnamed protein product [Schistosoma curassoni]|nr:unnamed protein product [Schistosoma curassoni]
MTQTLDVAENSWYLFNIKQAGFYRVHYADNNWELLTEQLYKDHRAIPLHSRTQILDDLFNLANRATVSYDVYLNLTKYLKKEDQYVVWETTRRALSYLDRMLAMDESYGAFQAYLRTLVDDPLKSVKWTTMKEDKDHMKLMLRLTLTRLACQAEHHSCVKMATEYYRNWMLNPSQNLIPPSLRPAVYCTAIRIGGQKEWEFLKQRLLEVDIKEDEKNSILQALSCSRDMWIIRLCVPTVILKILSKRHYTLNNIPDQEEVLAMQNSGQKLLENHVLKRGLNDLFKRSKENMKWTKTHRDVISNWLNKNVPNTITLL